MKYKILFLLLLIIITSGNSVFSTKNPTDRSHMSIYVKDNIDPLNFTKNSTYENAEIYVNSNYGNDSNDGLSPVNAKKTIRNAAESVADNGTIFIAEGFYMENSSTTNSWIPWENQDKIEISRININKNVKMLGKNVELDGSRFSFSPGKSVLLYGITFQNCPDSVLIVDNANLTVNNCKFQNLKNGSSLINNGGNLKLFNCQFINNKGIDGSAVYNNHGKVTIVNSTFDHNSANEDGGSIYSLGYLKVDTSSFTNNNARENGGAINIEEGEGIINCSSFVANGAYDGGAIKIQDNENKESLGKCDIAKCTFTNNTGTMGGAVNNRGFLTINESHFSENSAYSGGFMNNWGNCTVTYSTIANNNASGGGGISNVGSIVLQFNIITGNTADCGSAVLNEYGCNAEAINNWWGRDIIPSHVIGGVVSYTPVLKSPPTIPNIKFKN